MKTITLNLPPPLSVNKTRRIDRSAMPAIKAWKGQADALYLLQKRGLAGGTITGPFAATITISSSLRTDLDNNLKILLDTVRSYGLVPDDSPKYLRRITVAFGPTEHGARVELTALSSCSV
jgi:Holliday junction resolvase RusA-like endonuclease